MWALWSQFVPENPKFETVQSWNCWCHPWQFCWSTQERVFRWVTFCGKRLSVWSSFLNVVSPSVVFSVLSRCCSTRSAPYLSHPDRRLRNRSLLGMNPHDSLRLHSSVWKKLILPRNTELFFLYIPIGFLNTQIRDERFHVLTIWKIKRNCKLRCGLYSTSVLFALQIIKQSEYFHSFYFPITAYLSVSYYQKHCSSPNAHVWLLCLLPLWCKCVLFYHNCSLFGMQSI